MSVETAIDVAAARKNRRGPAEKLRDALDVLAQRRAQILDHREVAWASITFTGARHSLTLSFEGVEAAKAAEGFIADLPEHEFLLPGQLVADAAIISVDHAMVPDVRIEVKVELLLLVDA